MNRNTRTAVVLVIAVVVAALASFGVYRAIQQMPVRQVEVRSLFITFSQKSRPSLQSSMWRTVAVCRSPPPSWGKQLTD